MDVSLSCHTYCDTRRYMAETLLIRPKTPSFFQKKQNPLMPIHIHKMPLITNETLIVRKE